MVRGQGMTATVLGPVPDPKAEQAGAHLLQPVPDSLGFGAWKSVDRLVEVEEDLPPSRIENMAVFAPISIPQGQGYKGGRALEQAFG